MRQYDKVKAEYSGTDGTTEGLTPSQWVFVPTVDQRLQLVSVGSDCSIDAHTRDTLSTGWREITDLCHCEGGL